MTTNDLVTAVLAFVSMNGPIGAVAWLTGALAVILAMFYLLAKITARFSAQFRHRRYLRPFLEAGPKGWDVTERIENAPLSIPLSLRRINADAGARRVSPRHLVDNLSSAARIAASMDEKHSFNISAGASKQAALHFPRTKDVFQTRSILPLGKHFSHFSRETSIALQPSLIVFSFRPQTTTKGRVCHRPPSRVAATMASMSGIVAPLTAPPNPLSITFG
jgi:hypothetical protein